MKRRHFLKQATLATTAPLVMSRAPTRHETQPSVIKPPRLKVNDTVGIISPANAMFHTVDLDILEETLAALGLKMKLAPHALSRYGYFGGTDEERASDVNTMFADPEVDAILAFRGGWGCNRILPRLDYSTIQQHPKALIGYSDITGLLVAIYARTGLVTFHAPSGLSTWNAFTADYLRRVLFDAEAVLMTNPTETGDTLAQTENRIQTIHSGTVQGPLVGGNLTVLSALMGSDYLPDWTGHLLFLEDIGEAVYRIDRMMTQLKLAGVLDQISGFIFGHCTNCGPDSGGYASLTLEEVLNDHVRPLGIPAFRGAMIGHIRDKFTVPVGITAEMDADAGTIRLLEPAVV